MKKADYEALAGFRFALRQFFHFSEEAAQKSGLTTRQYQALLEITGFPGRERVTVGELADRLFIRHHSAVGLVDRLEAQELVARSPDTHDRRQVYVALTEKGSDMLLRLAAVHKEELRRLRPQISMMLDRLKEDSQAASD